MPATSSGLDIQDLSLLQPRLLWCYQGEPGSSSNQAMTIERHLYAWWLQRGHVTLKRGQQVFRAGAGQWMLGGPRPRLQRFSPGARILSINFQLEWPSGDSFIDELLVVDAVKFPALGRNAVNLLRYTRRHFPGVRTHLWQHPSDPVTFFELHALFSRWVSSYLKTITASGIMPARMSGLDSRVLAGLRELDHHAWAQPFRERDLASKAGLSVGHLNRLFMRDVGLSPGSYLQKRRLEAARARLQGTDEPVKEIAYALGFSSPAHFCHWFRLRSGQTPLTFRDTPAPKV